MDSAPAISGLGLPGNPAEPLVPRPEDRAGRPEPDEALRLEGARLLARTLQDRLGNQLALTVGYTELLLADPGLPPHLRAQAREAHAGALAAAATVHRVASLCHVAVQPGLAGEPTLLDLDHST